MSRTIVLWGQGRTAGTPSLWQTSRGTTDGGTAFAIRALSDPLRPVGAGGECLFCFAHLTITATMAAQLRVTPVVDGVAAPVPLSGGEVQLVTPIVTIAQQSGSPAQRRTTTVAIPLVKRVADTAGRERGRWFLRGEALQLLIESIGPLGAGELFLDGVEIEHEVVRRSLYTVAEG